jgi:ligand-binding sensor domain-containing protein
VDGGILKVFGPRDGLPDERWDAIRFLPNGDLWVRGGQHTAVRRHDTQRFTSIDALSGSFFSGYLDMDKEGSALIPTDDGLAIANGSHLDLIGQERGLPTSMVSTVLEDREGSIWVGLIGEGLARWIGRHEWEG